MSRTRTTLISLMLCAAVALAAAAPVPSRGGVASEVHTLEASSAVEFDPVPEQMRELDATIKAVQQERHDADVAAYIAAVHQAEVERAAAERAARAKPAPPPPTVVRPAGSGTCGGWADLIARYFPGEEGTACRVMICESGGNPTVHNAGSSASGLWQFLDRTWRSTTGTPGPAANYSAETQTAAAAKLRQSSGWSPWSCY